MFQNVSLANWATASPDTITEWRWTIFGVGVGAILLAIGLIAMGIFVFRKKNTDRALLYFGEFVILYAVRIFIREQPLLSVFAIPRAVAGHIEHAITFTIMVPSLLLFLDVVQTRWRRVMLSVLGVELVFAAFAIPFDLLGIASVETDIANSVLVLSSGTLMIVFVFFVRPPGRLSPELRVVAVGLAVFGLFVFRANLAGLRILPGRDVEPIGFLFLVCTLGYLVARRIFAKEESQALLLGENAAGH